MSSDKESVEVPNATLHSIELDVQPGEQTLSLPVISESFRSKTMYLCAGTLLLGP